MKAEYRRSMRFVSGKAGGFVHTKIKKGRKAVIRSFVQQELGEHNHHFGMVKKNIAAIWSECSAGFKNDLKSYTGQRKEFYSGEEIPVYSNYAHFISFLYRFRKENPEIDLATVSKDELVNAGIPTNVKDIIDQGFLPPVPEKGELVNDW